MQDEVNGHSDRKPVGGISDEDEQQDGDERTGVRKRTFTRWINAFLQRSDPPVVVCDLFTDVQDGRILMALLEELTGCKLLYRFRSSPRRIFRLNNISKALAFLDDKPVKLLGVDASGIADGIPSVVLNLVWSIILHFQVKQVTAGLQSHLSSSLSSLCTSSYSSDLRPRTNDTCSPLPSKGTKAAGESTYHGKTIRILLQWVQTCTAKFGVEVQDFGKSWRSGLAFLALIKSINPALVDLRDSLSRDPRENIQLAFTVAYRSLDVPPLLEPEDVLCTVTDEQSIITYVSTFLHHCWGLDEDRATEVPQFPNFHSVEPAGFGETLVDEPEAQALLRGLERSKEQLLWKKWARRSSGSPGGAVTSVEPGACVTTLPFSRKKSQSQNPPSPLDAAVVSQEIRSWMKKSAADQKYDTPTIGESHVSLSSEEGIYSLSALDSEEDEAYSPILDLNKEVFQPQPQLKTPRVEELKAEELFLNVWQTEEDVRLEVQAQSGILWKSDWNKNKSRETINNADVSEPGEEIRSRGRCEDESVVTGQIHEDSDGEKEKEKTQNAAGSLMHGYEKSEADSWKTDGLFERRGPASEKRATDREEEEEEKTVRGSSATIGSEEGQRGKRGEDQEERSHEVMNSVDCEKKDRQKPKETTTDTGVKGHSSDMTWTPASTATSQTFREGGFVLETLAATCDITPLELEMLLILWILIYCCFILHHLIF